MSGFYCAPYGLWELCWLVSAREVVQGDERMRLAATEVGLQLDRGIAGVSPQS